jgi:hypothetical protein
MSSPAVPLLLLSDVGKGLEVDAWVTAGMNPALWRRQDLLSIVGIVSSGQDGPSIAPR